MAKKSLKGLITVVKSLRPSSTQQFVFASAGLLSQPPCSHVEWLLSLLGVKSNTKDKTGHEKYKFLNTANS